MGDATHPRHLLKTLPLQIADFLGEQISSGMLPPGQRLRETDLATTYEVSRATVREALRLLETRGLVRIQPQRGAYVTQLSAKEIYDLYAIRASLVSTGSRLAAERCTNKNARVLRHKLLLLADSVDDLSAYTRQSRELVAYITMLSDNAILIGYVNDMADRIGRYVRISLSKLERRKRSLVTWKKTIDAIVSGDPERAAACHYQLAIQNRDAALKEFDKADEQEESGL